MCIRDRDAAKDRRIRWDDIEQDHAPTVALTVRQPTGQAVPVVRLRLNLELHRLIVECPSRTAPVWPTRICAKAALLMGQPGVNKVTFALERVQT